MVGLNVVSPQKGKYSEYETKFKTIQKKMLHTEYYSSDVHFSEENLIVGFNSYKTYPKRIFENGEIFYVIEGMIYNKKDLSVDKWIQSTFLKRPKADGELFDTVSEFILNTDGEYIVLIYNKSDNRLTIFNDALGRLPLFYSLSHGILCISREVKFITYFIDSIDFDKFALMEYLLFGSPLGERSLVRGILRILPSTMIQFDCKSRNLEKTILYAINFDRVNKQFESRNIQLNKITRLFRNGLRNRVNTVKSDMNLLMAMSGGLDSRATLAGLKQLNKKPICYSRVHLHSNEIEYVKGICKEFGLKVNQLRENEGALCIEEYNRLVTLKDGLIPTSRASFLRYYNQLDERYGEKKVIFTGIYGEVLGSYNTWNNIKNEDELMKNIISFKSKYNFSITEVSKMLNVSQMRFKKHLKKYIMNYPEIEISNKYQHFKFELCHTWVDEGEDLHRLFYWCITPFFSLPLFKYSTYDIRNKDKNLLFFRDFLYTLDPRTCRVGCYNKNLDLNNIWQLISIMGETESPSKAQGRLKMEKKGNSIIKSEDEQIKALLDIKMILLNILKHSKLAKEYFREDKTLQIIKEEQDNNKNHKLLTIILYMAQIEKQKESIINYEIERI